MGRRIPGSVQEEQVQEAIARTVRKFGVDLYDCNVVVSAQEAMANNMDAEVRQFLQCAPLLG